MAFTNDVFTVGGAEGSTAAYVNGGGYIHQITTLRRLVDENKVVFEGFPSTENRCEKRKKLTKYGLHLNFTHHIDPVLCFHSALHEATFLDIVGISLVAVAVLRCWGGNFEDQTPRAVADQRRKISQTLFSGSCRPM
jgi:hypothetical protein